MFVRMTLETLIAVALSAALCFEDKMVRFERDCRAIRRACRRQGITARVLLKRIRQEARK